MIYFGALGGVGMDKFLNNLSDFYTLAGQNKITSAVVNNVGAMISVKCYGDWYILIKRNTTGVLYIGETIEGLAEEKIHWTLLS